MRKITFRRLISLLVTAASLCVFVGCGGDNVGNTGEVDSYLGMFNPALSLLTSPPNGGTVWTFPDEGEIYRYGDTVTVTAVPQKDYDFLGWSGASMDTARSVTIIMDGNKTLTANFVPTYTIIFNANGGNGTPPKTLVVPESTSITLPDGGNLKLPGSNFGGWTLKRTSTDYLAGATFIVTESDTLFAKWGTEYTVMFNANGGSGISPKTQVVPAGSNINLPDSNGLSKNGYAFSGWSTNTSGVGGTNYGIGKTYTPSGNVTLYAIWINVYTVTFDANGANGVAAPKPQTIKSGTVITLPSPGNWSNYVFDGWTDGLSHKIYSAGDAYTVVGNTLMSANWNPIYTVTFNLSGGTGTAPSLQTVTSPHTDITLPLPKATKPGYVFGGWNTAIGGAELAYQAGDSYHVTENITFYAYWKPEPIVPTEPDEP